MALGEAFFLAEMQERPSERLLVCAALCWLSAEEILLQQRSLRARHGAGAWELAGGKIERGESSRAALARELCEEWGPAAKGLPILEVAEILHHCYPAPDPEVHLIVFHVDGRSLARGRWQDRLETEEGARLGAFRLGELPIAQCLEADREFLRSLSPYSGFDSPPA